MTGICVPFLVLGEIEERRLFLSEMEALGQGREHHSKIMTEISQVYTYIHVYLKITVSIINTGCLFFF